MEMLRCATWCFVLRPPALNRLFQRASSVATSRDLLYWEGRKLGEGNWGLMMRASPLLPYLDSFFFIEWVILTLKLLSR